MYVLFVLHSSDLLYQCIKQSSQFESKSLLIPFFHQYYFYYFLTVMPPVIVFYVGREKTRNDYSLLVQEVKQRDVNYAQLRFYLFFTHAQEAQAQCIDINNVFDKQIQMKYLSHQISAARTVGFSGPRMRSLCLHRPAQGTAVSSVDCFNQNL